jgi:hypothetical protein
MQCKLSLIILTKTKEIIHYCESFGYGGKVALNTVSNDLMQVSVPAKKDHNSHQPSHMSLSDQHSCVHSCQ